MEEAADLRVRTDAGKLLLEFEELNEFRGVLGFLCHLCNEVVWTGGKFQGSFFGAKNIELLPVFKDSNVWITCERSVKYCKLNGLQAQLVRLTMLLILYPFKQNVLYILGLRI